MNQLNKKEVKKLFKEDKRDKEIALILEDIQYARNVATIFRTCDAAGVRRLYLTGITTTPPFGKDLKKASRNKEKSIEWIYKEESGKTIANLKKQGYKIIAIELTDKGFTNLELASKIKSLDKVCFIAGNEVHGVKKSTLEKCDASVYLPMYGRGGSLNVGVSIGAILYSF